MRNAPEEFSRVMSCDYCSRQGYPKLLRDDSFNLPQPGYIGANYRKSRVLLVGQNPGTSPDRFGAQDREFADAQITLRDSPTAHSMRRLHAINDRIMPTWPVVKNYFRLDDYGLQLDEIAYVNVVRCRTKENGVPGKRITEACIKNHFERWLDWLQPAVVVCIGKWSHDAISELLEERRIPNGFVNRKRSLSGAEREENRASVAELARRVLSGTPMVAAAHSPEPSQSTAVAARVADIRHARSKEGNTMDAAGYLELFQKLGFQAKEKPNDGRILRHKTKNVPSLYFNRSRHGRICFVGIAEDEHLFPTGLWERIPPQKPKDDLPTRITLVPKAGREEEAFRILLGS